MIGKRAFIALVAVLLLAVPSLAQEVSDRSGQKAQPWALRFARPQEQAASRKIWGSQRATSKWMSLPASCSAGAICPVW
jgi:hypothetical protein